jgi:hypothetical protein
MQRTSADANDIYLTALRAYDSTVKEVSVYSLGGCRWGSGDFVVNLHPWNTLPAIAAISPNLVIFEAGSSTTGMIAFPFQPSAPT